MSALILLTGRDRHLCGHGREVLDELAVNWREVSTQSEEGRRLATAAPPMLPVCTGADGRVLGYGRLSLKKLRKQLDRAAVTA